MRGSVFSKAGRLFAVLALIASGSARADILPGHSGDLSGNTAALTTDYVRHERLL